MGLKIFFLPTQIVLFQALYFEKSAYFIDFLKKLNFYYSRSNLKDSSSAGNLCKYIHRHCFQERIQGYDFCIRHILEDKNAPFRQCTYIQQPHEKKCTNAAPKTDKNDKRVEA